MPALMPGFCMHAWFGHTIHTLAEQVQTLKVWNLSSRGAQMHHANFKKTGDKAGTSSIREAISVASGFQSNSANLFQ